MRELSRERTLEQIKTFGKQTFVVDENHLKLLPHLNIEFNRYGYEGAPGVDNKRPYGNSDVYGDIHEILYGVESHWDEETDEDLITDASYELYKKIHEEMGTVLLICAQNNGVELGEYISAKYFDEWTKA